MSLHSRWRLHAEFAAKQMDLVPKVPQSLCRLKEIALGSALEIETFMNQRDFQGMEVFSLSWRCCQFRRARAAAGHSQDNIRL